MSDLYFIFFVTGNVFINAFILLFVQIYVLGKNRKDFILHLCSDMVLVCKNAAFFTVSFSNRSGQKQISWAVSEFTP